MLSSVLKPIYRQTQRPLMAWSLVAGKDALRNRRLMSSTEPLRTPRRHKDSVRFPDWIEKWSQQAFIKTAGASWVALATTFALVGPDHAAPWILGAPLFGFTYIGIRDMSQTSHAIRRNFPVLGNMRYILEAVRPEIRQYFVESDSAADPFSRAQRSIVYQRSKGLSDSMPLGTKMDVYADGYEWLAHSMYPKHIKPEDLRVTIGGPDCTQPYSASILNISAMSYGALSDNAVLALNGGAAMGNFYHNTGEGGVSRFHIKPGADIVWNIGTGYFGCRAKDGSFDPKRFADQANIPNIKMIEIKFSQGAKPAHGGILPKAKITPEIAEARGVGMDEDCNSPPAHTAFHDPDSFVLFVKQLRELSNGKPIGFKLCVGRKEEFILLVKAMLRHNITPDFITVDGGEGGTGAAPPEFSNAIGVPLVEGLTFVNNVLRGAGIRDRIKLIASGRILTAVSVVRAMALGADLCNSARAMMFALGCIQALKCNTNQCPTGITTSNKELQKGLVVPDKATRVYNFHKQTVHSVAEVLGAAGVSGPSELSPAHFFKRTSEIEYRSYAQLYPKCEMNALVNGNGYTGNIDLHHEWRNAENFAQGKKAEADPS